VTAALVWVMPHHLEYVCVEHLQVVEGEVVVQRIHERWRNHEIVPRLEGVQQRRVAGAGVLRPAQREIDDASCCCCSSGRGDLKSPTLMTSLMASAESTMIAGCSSYCPDADCESRMMT